MFPFSEQQIIAAFLLFVRVGTLLMLMPVTGHRSVPATVKIGLALLISLLLWPVVSQQLPAIPNHPLALALLIGKELLLAGMLALLAELIFAAVQLAGQLISFQMGLAVANVFDPASSTQIAVVGQLASVLGMLVWLACGAHLIFIHALADSFTLLPIGGEWSLYGWSALDRAASAMFLLGLKLAAPVLLLLLFINVALALIARAVPQIQVFFVSQPLTLAVGLAAFALAMPAFVSLASDSFRALAIQAPNLLKMLAEG